MNFSLKPIVLATLVATIPLAGVAYAQAPKAPATSLTQPAPAAPGESIRTKSPGDWILYEDTAYSPVVDDVSRHLDAARKAFGAKDNKTAAIEMRVVADELALQATRAGKKDEALVGEDRALLTADTKYERDTIKRLHSSALKTRAAAAGIESGKIKTNADLDKAIDKAARADMDRRWLVTDVTTWYPVSEEPQRHFTNAVADYARKDYKAAAADIRKAGSYLRLEAGRATGEAKRELDSSIAQLDTFAVSVEKGAMKDEQAMAKAFARANHALALEHRSKAAESWARKEYRTAGYELKAAAHGLESAAGWVGGEAQAGAAASVADTRALGGKLASSATWTRNEVAKGFELLGNGLNALGQKIGGTRKASPFHMSA